MSGRFTTLAGCRCIHVPCQSLFLIRPRLKFDGALLFRGNVQDVADFYEMHLGEGPRCRTFLFPVIGAPMSIIRAASVDRLPNLLHDDLGNGNVARRL